MGSLYEFAGTTWSETEEVDDPGCVADGERFWVWSDGETVWINFEEWEGQADVGLPALLAEHPHLLGLPIDDDSPWSPDADTLGGVCSSLPPPVTVGDVERWYHGTTEDRLEAMLADGVRGDLPSEMRVWRLADIPHGVVYLTCDPSVAAEYARHAARGGREPVTVEIEASALDADLFEADRDFGFLAVAQSRHHGSLADLSEVDASLTLTGRVGYRGTVPAAALSAAIGRTGRRELERAGAPVSAP